MRLAHALESLALEARHGLRLWRRSPGFTVVALATLALAIGVNAAVWSVVDSLLLRPLPYPEPDRLALLSVSYRSDSEEYRSTAVDGRTWELFRDEPRRFERAVFSGWSTGVNLVPAGGAANVQQQRVGAGFFRVLGGSLLHGREFLPEEDVAGGPAVAILSHELWTSRFGADPAVVGRTALVRGEPTEVVGVLSPSFVSLGAATGGEGADLYTPLRASTTGEGGGTNFQVLARVPAGGSWDEAAAEAAAVGNADFLARETRADVTATYSLEPLQRALTADLQRPLLLLSAAVALVLLIACVDIAGLLLARGRARQHEIATRGALGGGRAAIVRMLLVESLVLALLGGALGIVVGQLAVRGLVALSRDVFALGGGTIPLDARALAAVFVLSLVAAMLFGLLPALQASRLDVRSAIAVGGGGRGVAGGSSRATQRWLVVGEVALGVVILVGAGLLVRTFVHLQRLEPGFEPGSVVVARASLQDARYTEGGAVDRLFAESVAALEQVPGVAAAAVSLGLPYERLLNIGFEPLDAAVEEPRNTITNLAYVTPRYFETFGVPLRAGRPFGDGDGRDDSGVAIVNQAFARAYLGERDPLGLRIGAAGRERRIVGVAGDVQQQPGWGEYRPLAAMPMVYVPATQVEGAFHVLVHTWFTPAWSVRVDGRVADAAQLAPAIREVLGRVDPQLPVAEVASMSEVMGRSLAHQRFLMTLVSVLGGVAALLAALGLHGLIAGSVAERERETGIRIALGATGFEAMRRLALPGVGLAGVGVALGTVASLLAVRALGSLLHGVAPTDPATFVAVALLLLGVAAVASALPALRVLRHDPAATLRGQ
jgi:predicted permease